MNSTTRHAMKRTLSMALVLAMMLTIVPFFGLQVQAASAVTNPTVKTAVLAKLGLTDADVPHSGIFAIDIGGNKSVIGTLNVGQLKTDFPNLSSLKINNTNITNIVNPVAGVAVYSDGTFISGSVGQRTLTAPSSSISYSLASSSSGIVLDNYINALQINATDGTTIADLVSVVSCSIDGTPVTLSTGGVTYGVIPHSVLSGLSVGTSHTVELKLSFKNTTGLPAWTYPVNYTLTVSDEKLELLPLTNTVYQGGTVELALNKYDEQGNAVDVGSDTGTIPNLTVTNPFSSSSYTATKVGNSLKINFTIDPTEAAASYTVSVADSLSGKTASATITVQTLPAIAALELKEYNNSAYHADFDVINDVMYIKGGTSISSRDQTNVVSPPGGTSPYTNATDYWLYDGVNQLVDAYCSVLEVNDTSGNVTGEFISVNGYAVLRVYGTAFSSGTGTFNIDSTLASTLATVNYTITATSEPSEYTLYMFDAGVYDISTISNLHNLINTAALPTGIEEIATFVKDAGNTWNPTSGTATANILEQKDVWFAVAARYENGGVMFAVPFTSASGWYESNNGVLGMTFGSSPQPFAANSDILGNTEAVGGGTTLGLYVTPQLGSGGDTVPAVVQISNSVVTNTLYFSIEVTARSVDHYEFRTAAGATLVPADSLVPIGTSKDYQIYAIYDNGQAELVDFVTTPMTVSVSDRDVLPLSSNPTGVNSGNQLTVTATSDGGYNDKRARDGETSDITVTDTAGNTGTMTITLGYSQIKDLTYYVETPKGIFEYGTSTEIVDVYSEATAGGRTLEIPRGLSADVWAVPVFTNDTMYDGDAVTGNWKDFGATSGVAFDSTTSALSGSVFTAPSYSNGAHVISADGNIQVDIGAQINTTFEINAAVVVNTISHDLYNSLSSVNTGLVIKIADPIITDIKVEQWDDTSAIYAPPATALSGKVGDELKFRVRVIYSDGTSIDSIGNNGANTYRNGTVFLPLGNWMTYDPSTGYTEVPTALDFGGGNALQGLGVIHGHLMSRRPVLYSALVNPSATPPSPSQSDWYYNNSSIGIHGILETLTKQIRTHYVTGTTGGITLDYMTVSAGGIIPGHFSIKLNQSGSYTFDFSGTYSANGFNHDIEINGGPISVTVSAPTIEKLYLVSDELDYKSTATVGAITADIYEFEMTSLVYTFRVYPMILDSSYYLSSNYTGTLPAQLSGTASASTMGISKVYQGDWTSDIIGTWITSNTGLLLIQQKVDTTDNSIYLEVTVIGANPIDITSPVTISLNNTSSATQVGNKYDIPPNPADPTPMAVYTVTDPVVQDIIIGAGSTATQNPTNSVEVNDAIYYSVKYMISGSITPRLLRATEYPGSTAQYNVLKVDAAGTNPAACVFAIESFTGALKFSPTVVGTYTFTLSTINTANAIIPASSQGTRTITFTVTPQQLTQTLYYGQSVQVSGLVPAAASSNETGTSAQLDAVSLAIGTLKMTNNADGNTTVEVLDASGAVIAEIAVTLKACDVDVALVPALLTNSITRYTFADGESMCIQWEIKYSIPGTSTVTCIEYSNVSAITSVGFDDFLTLNPSTSTVTATAPAGTTGILDGIYTAQYSPTIIGVIYALLNPSLVPPIYSYQLHDNNVGTSNVLTSINMTVGDTQNVYVYDTTNSVYVNSFTATATAGSSLVSITNMGSYAVITALSPGTAAITFAPLQGGAPVTLAITINAPAVITHTVTYNANGGAGLMNPSTVNHGPNHTVLSNAFTAPSVNEQFKEWNTLANGTGTSYDPGDIITVNTDITLYAIWENIPVGTTVTVTYDANDGVTAQIDDVIQQGTSHTVRSSTTFTAPSANEQFKEWNTASDGSGTSYDPGDIIPAVNADITLYAIWENIPVGNTVTVTYDANDGVTATFDVVEQQGASHTVLSDNTFTAPSGKQFKEWNTASDGSGTGYNPGQAITVTADITLYAVWENIPVGNTVTVTYNANGGTGSMNPVTVNQGASHTIRSNRFTAPAGKQFKEWNTASNGSGTSYDPRDVITVNADITIYAIWENTPVSNKVTVTYNANGGTGFMNPVTVNQGANHTAQISGFAAPSGKRFVEWNTASNGSGISYNPGAVITVNANITLYAIWENIPTSGTNYTVTYNANGGSGSMSPYTGTSPYIIRANAFTAPDGKQFKEWNTASNGSGRTYKPYDSITLNANITLYAIWENIASGNNHTIIYFENVGTSSLAYDSAPHGATYTILPNKFTAPAWTQFREWNTASDGSGMKYFPGDKIIVNSDVSLYAIWEPTGGGTTPPVQSTYTVSYNANGATVGNVPVDTARYYEGGTVVVRDNTGGLAKSGYTFVGWAADSAGIGFVYYPNSVYTMGTFNITFYAVWRTTAADYSSTTNNNTSTNDSTSYAIMTYSVTFDSQGGSLINKIIGIPANSKIDAPETPVRNGYIFTGWFKDAACRLSWNFKTDSVTKNMTLYAGWRKDTPHEAFISGLGDGKFGPDESMTRAQSAQILYNLSGGAEVKGGTFSDVPRDAWFYKAVATLSGMKILNGYTNGTFGPNNTVTRGEFISMAMRFSGIEVSANTSSGSHWSSGYIAAANAAGYLKGYLDYNFNPDTAITRAEAVTLINRILGYSPDKSYIDNNLGSLTTFKDVLKSHWAYYDIIEAANTHKYVLDGTTEKWTK